MKWILVLIAISGSGDIIAEQHAIMDNMTDCFYAREELVWTLFGDPSGRPPTNFQVLCVPSDKYE